MNNLSKIILKSYFSILKKNELKIKLILKFNLIIIKNLN